MSAAREDLDTDTDGEASSHSKTYPPQHKGAEELQLDALPKAVAEDLKTFVPMESFQRRMRTYCYCFCKSFNEHCETMLLGQAASVTNRRANCLLLCVCPSVAEVFGVALGYTLKSFLWSA